MGANEAIRLPEPADRTKLSWEGITNRIENVQYARIGATMTQCLITMRNGWIVSGTSACVDPDNFNENVGKELAYEDAFRQLWPLEGYLLAERRSQEGPAAANAAASRLPANSAQELLNALAYSSSTHEVVSAARLTPLEAEKAKAEGRTFVDRYGCGFVLRSSKPGRLD
jgi:hypothetical protein